MTKINKKANFWIKLITKLLDFIPITGITIGLLFGMMSHTTGNWIFNEVWMFYVWCIIVMMLILVTYIAIPVLTKGRTIGMFVTRIKIISEEKNLNLGIIKREVFFSITWVVMTLLVMSIINNTLIYKFASTAIRPSLTTIESLRIGIVSAIGSIAMVIQMFLGISGAIRRDKRALNDVYANTNVVWTNKFIEVRKKKGLRDKSAKLAPKPYIEHTINWEE